MGLWEKIKDTFIYEEEEENTNKEEQEEIKSLRPRRRVDSPPARSFARRIPMKLVSWNVNGLRACLNKDFSASFAAFSITAIAF